MQRPMCQIRFPREKVKTGDGAISEIEDRDVFGPDRQRIEEEVGCKLMYASP